IAALDTRPVSQEVLIIAIDHASLAALGRWPWRRAVHAALLEQLSTHDVKAVGLTLLLSDADAGHPDDDQRLAGAMRRVGRVVLPLYANWPEGPRVEPALPQPVLREAARALGHVHVELDDDGVARRVFLRAGVAREQRDHGAPALLAAGRGALAPSRLP